MILSLFRFPNKRVALGHSTEVLPWIVAQLLAEAGGMFLGLFRKLKVLVRGGRGAGMGQSRGGPGGSRGAGSAGGSGDDGRDGRGGRDGGAVPTRLDLAETQIKRMLGEGSSDVILRRVDLWTSPEIHGLLFYIEGLADRATINIVGLDALMHGKRGPHISSFPKDPIALVDLIISHLLPSGQISAVDDLNKVVDKVLTGEAALFIEGSPKAILFEAKGWEHRTVGEPSAEKTLRGPRESFTEVLRINTALVRRRLKTPDLRFEGTTVGLRSKTDVMVVYIEGITDPRLVEEVKKRLSCIDTDIAGDSGVIEEFIEDSPASPFPQMQYTERPDRFCAGVSEGLVGIIVDTSPFALMAPTNLAAFFQSAEDFYDRFPFAGPLRSLRYAAGLLALTFPAFYVAIATHHQEMLPTRLALAIAGSHLSVPFPTLVEAILMEVALELIRESAVRMPDPVGQTMGFVGALLLGDAAVSAGLVSPIMVIVVAVTGLASFSIPHYSVGLAVRLLRFPLLLLSAWTGLFGLTAGLVAIALHLSGLTSLGVPYVQPLVYTRDLFKDVLWRAPIFRQQFRPSFARPQDKIRQGSSNRRWAEDERVAKEDVDGPEDVPRR